MFRDLSRKKNGGMTLIDTLVSTALMVVVFIGIFAAFNLSLMVVGNNKARAGAIALVNERMEYLRSLSYSLIGVIGGIPAGNVPQIETLNVGGMNYTRRTSVQYTDDPGDGVGGADLNGVIADYKTIRVESSWLSAQGQRSVTLVGRVSPPAVETAVPGGTLIINVVDAAAAPLYDAQVDIANVSTTPPINIRTYTNSAGSVTFIGAPSASNYQILVSKSGYSSAQTYAPSIANPNPDPRHLTVASGTTMSTFAIDRVSSKTVETYKAVVEQSWQDLFNDATKIATSTNITVSAGNAHLTGPDPYPAWGAVQSVAIAPAYLSKWKALSWTHSTSTQTSIAYRLYDGSGTSLIPDAHVPGNSAGLIVSPIDLTNVPIATYPSIRVQAELATSDISSTPSLSEWTVTYDYGPEPFPNLTFNLRGAKTIGNGPSVYKYDQSHSSGAGASITLSNMEWDSYAVTIPGTGYAIAESCDTQPETLDPNSSQTTRIYAKAESPHSLLIDVRETGGALIPGATARLTRIGYDVTQLTSACGQTFYDNISSATYTLTVTKNGYQQYTNPGVVVSGQSKISVALQSL